MNDEIKVTTVVKGVDDDGFTKEDEEVTKSLFTSVKSADYLDRQQSMNQKTIASIVFEVRREDFDLCRVTSNKKHYYPSYVEWDGALYTLIRWRYLGQDKAVMICG